MPSSLVKLSLMFYSVPCGSTASGHEQRRSAQPGRDGGASARRRRTGDDDGAAGDDDGAAGDDDGAAGDDVRLWRCEVRTMWNARCWSSLRANGLRRLRHLRLVVEGIPWRRVAVGWSWGEGSCKNGSRTSFDWTMKI